MAKKSKKARKGEESRLLGEHRIEEFLPLRWDHPLWWGVPSIPDLMAPASARIPKVNMVDLGDAILVEAELPGVASQGVQVTGSDNALTVRATPAGQEEPSARDYYYREMGRGEYQRTLLLPCRVDWGSVEAKIRDGILTLRCAKESAAGEAKACHDVAVS